MQERPGEGPGILGPGPPHHRRDQVDEQEAWIERTAVELARTLACPAVRARVLALLDGHERDRERRREAARRDLASIELRWKLAEDEVWEP
jgi:hypothetical protein